MQHRAPVQPHVLDEPVRPAPQLLAEELEVVRLDRVADRLGQEADLAVGGVERPCQVHVLRHRAARPAADRTQLGGAVDREAARRDQRLAVVVLDPLEEAEREQVLDVAAALPDGRDPAREDQPAGGRDLRIVEGGQQELDRVRRERGVGVDGHHQVRPHRGRARRSARRPSSRCSRAGAARSPRTSARSRRSRRSSSRRRPRSRSAAASAAAASAGCPPASRPRCRPGR